VDIILGPEMKSTGEVMGIDRDFAAAFAKSQIAAGIEMVREGRVFISMAGRHKEAIIEPARRLQSLGLKIIATSGTASTLRQAGIDVEYVKKVQEGRPNLLDDMANGDVQFIFNTPSGKGSRTDEGKIRAAAVSYGVPCVTTLPGCLAMVSAIEYMHAHRQPQVRALQDWMAEQREAQA
jgi:carbamoyl-phosphate synthase large subunit